MIVFTHAGIPLPSIQFHPFADGAAEPVVAGRPVLLNVWASWCAPCLTELRSFAGHADALQRFGLDIVAASIDPLTDQGSLEQAHRQLAEMGWPFRGGTVSRATVDQLKRMHDFVFDLHEPPVIPTSYLIDGAGNLQAVIKGPIEPQELMAQISRLTRVPMEGPERRDLTIPFPGRWFAPARRLHYIDLAMGEAEAGDLEVAMGYFHDHEAIFLQSPQAPRLLVALGRRLASEGQVREAEYFLRRAVEAVPRYIDALAELARLLVADPETSPERSREALRHAEQACLLSAHRDPELLETLALAHAKAGDIPAARERLEAAIRLARESNRQSLLEALETRRESFPK